MPTVDAVIEAIAEGAIKQALDNQQQTAEPLPTVPWEFATKCCYTIDEASAWQTDEVIRKFPEWPYLKDVVEFMDGQRYGRIDKSGQLMVSWAVIAYRLWCVLTKRGFKYAYFCGTQTKAERHVSNRFWRMYLSIPANYAKPHATLVGGQLLVYHDGPDRLPTSMVVPMAAEQRVIDVAADKMRSETWTAADLDESPFYPNLEELHNGLMPRTQDLHHIGTPNGMEFFYKLGFGNIHDNKDRAVSFEELKDRKEVRRGVSRWARNGFEHLRVTFEAHPLRSSETAEGLEWQKNMRARMSTRQFQREQECAYEVAAGTPVYCDTDRIKVTAQEYCPWLPMVRGHDYSFLWNVCLVAQIRPFRGRPGRFKLHFLREIYSCESDITPHAKKVKEECAKNYGSEIEWIDHGDYSANQRTSTGAIIDRMREVGFALVTIPTGPGGVLKGCSIFQQLITEYAVEVDPQCVMLLQSLKSQYVRDMDGEPKAEHPAADFADSARYIIANQFQVQDLPGGGKVVTLKHDFHGHRDTGVVGDKPLPVRITEDEGIVSPKQWSGQR